MSIFTSWRAGGSAFDVSCWTVTGATPDHFRIFAVHRALDPDAVAARVDGDRAGPADVPHERPAVPSDALLGVPRPT
ncbi:hypothetical protein ACIPC1_11520 [Streptomyces sp. NPDC087263]|uniref:hypothetical protein n=1 Tax=Streptomyces sp. NPDC087263 TaxID=3365773 RepID=UPI0037F6E2F1